MVLMTDFDERLSAVLTAEAEDAPHPAGLASAARRRHVLRRRRQVSGAAAAAVLAAVATAALWGGGEGRPDDSLVADPGSSSSDDAEWQTIRKDDVRVEVPADWRAFTCTWDDEGGGTFEVYGATEDDACHYRAALAFYGSATFDAITGPGVITGQKGDSWGGYSMSGDYAVYVVTFDRDLTRQILATARTDGQPEIDASEWIRLVGDGITAEIPASWGVDPDRYELQDFTVCAAPGEADHPPVVESQQRGPVDSYASFKYDDGRWISVSAPTPAIADLVAASARSRPGHGDDVECAPQIAG